MIITDEKLLRTPCENVLSNEVGELVDLLERELEHSGELGRPGIGLALPQIGIFKKLAIVRINTNGLQDLNINLVNATIENGYDPIQFKDEGCLSFPNQTKTTKRFNEIHVTNNLVEPYGFVATGLMSIAIQHELDHLSGILFLDRAVEESAGITTKVARPNDLCPCGSKLKYKRCCLRKHHV